MKKTAVRIYVAAFLMILCLPWLFWGLFKGYFDSENHENRKLKERPSLTAETYETFFKDYEEYYNDNIPFRNPLISLNTGLDYFLFQTSSNQNVIIGKDNWLFYNDEDDGDPIASYWGENLFTEEELQQIAENCIHIRDELKSMGKEFVLFIAPNKERVYSEMLPKKYGEPAEMYAALQLVEYLRENTDIRVVYPYAELMQAKKELPGCIIYNKTDTHWNFVGGYVGARALLGELGISMPEVDSDLISIREKKLEAGDLAGLLNQKRILTKMERGFSLSGYDTHNLDVLQAEQFFAVVFRSEAQNADPRKIYINGDSFLTYMERVIGSQFNSAYMRHKDFYSYDIFQEKDPDIFVYETVERHVDGLLTFNFWQE